MQMGTVYVAARSVYKLTFFFLDCIPAFIFIFILNVLFL